MGKNVSIALAIALNFEETVNHVQERNLSYSETEIEEAIEEAIRETRATYRFLRIFKKSRKIII